MNGQPGEHLAELHGWLRRLTPTLAAAEDLTVEVVRRLRAAEHPAWLASRPAAVRHRFVCTQVVLQARGVL